MKERRVVLARNTLDDESSASTFSAQSGSGHRAIGKCHGRCDSKTEWIVLSNIFSTPWHVDHISTVAICEALKVIGFYGSDIVSILFVRAARLSSSGRQARGSETRDADCMHRSAQRSRS
jgi:hypothetical protein